MKFRGTFVLAAIVVMLAGYTFWDYRKTRDAGDLQSGERLAFSLERAKISHIRFERGAEKVELERKDDEWHMLSPVDDWAEDSTVDGFLFAIMGEKVRTFREDAGTPDWSAFGLKPPGVSVELSTGARTEKIDVSSTNAFDGSYYVRQNDELLAGAVSLAQATNRTANSFRSRRIWRHADASVTRVKSESPAGSFTLDKSSGTWTMTPAPKFALDPERVDKWVDAVEDLTAADFVREGVTEGLAAWGLDKPKTRVSIDYQAPSEKAGQWILSLGPEKATDVFFYTNDRATIAKTAATSVRKISATPEYFRDGHQPFAFDAEAAREIRIRTPKVSLVARKTGAEWQLADAKDGASLDEAQFKDFVGALGALRALDFPGRAVAVKAKPSVEVLDGAGRALVRLSFGDEYKSKAIWNEGASLRAVSAGSAETLGLPKAQIDNLIRESLIKAKAPTPAAAKPEAPAPKK